MRRDIALLMLCDGVALLDGWQKSRGATLEYFIAINLAIPAMELEHWLQLPQDRPSPARPLPVPPEPGPNLIPDIAQRLTIHPQTFHAHS